MTSDAPHQKHRRGWLIAVGLLILVVGFLGFLPQLINLAPVKAEIVQQVSRRLDVRVAYERLDLRFWPRMRVVFTDIVLSKNGAPQGATFRARKLEANLALAPLVRGHVEISRLTFTAPHVRFSWSPQSPVAGSRKPHPWLDTGLPRLWSGLRDVALSNADRALRIRITDGHVVWQRDRHTIHLLADAGMDLVLGQGQISVKMEGSGDWWRKLEFGWQSHFLTARGHGRLAVSGWRISALKPLSLEWGVVSHPADTLDVSADFSTQQLMPISAQVRLSAQELRLSTAKGRTRWHQPQAAFDYRKDRQGIRLRLLRAGSPSLGAEIAGQLDLDEAGIAWRLQAPEVDVVPLRKSLLALMPETPFVRDLFGLIREGRVHNLSLRRQRGASRRVWDLPALVLKGDVDQASLRIARPALAFNSVAGHVGLSQGVLRVTNLSGRWQAVQLQKGVLRMDFGATDKTPFDLTLAFLGAPQQLLHLARSSVSGADVGPFLNELTLTGSEDFKGRLHLGPALASLTPELHLQGGRVEVGASRLPLPLTLDDVAVEIGQKSLIVRSDAGHLGDHGYEGAKVEILLNAKPQLALSIDRAYLEMAPLTRQWQASNSDRKWGLSGQVWLQALSVSGPLDDYNQWQGHGRGAVRSLVLTPKSGAGVATMGPGDFKLAWRPGVSSVEYELVLPDMPVSEGRSKGRFEGYLRQKAGLVGFGGNLSATLLDVDQILQHIRMFETHTEPRKGDHAGAGGETAYEGSLAISADRLTFDAKPGQGLSAQIDVAQDNLLVTVSSATLCGISASALWRRSETGQELYLYPHARDLEIGPTLDCLGHDRNLLSGRMDLTGNFHRAQKRDQKTAGWKGAAQVSARNGRIYRADILSKILALLNLTEIYRGRLPDLLEAGFAYDALEIRAGLDHTLLEITELMVDGASMEIVGQGVIDLVRQSLRGDLVVSPLKTVDTLVKQLPVVREVLGGNLVSIPFRVQGPVADPDVRIVPLKEVGESILALARRALAAPFNLVSPLLPNGQP